MSELYWNPKGYGKLYNGDVLDCLKRIPSNKIACCVTGPPYWNLRDYGHKKQIGLEETPEEYIARIVEVFIEVLRVLKPDGTCWINLGDSYYNNYGGGSSTCTTGNKKAIQIRGRSKVKKHPYLKIKDMCGIPHKIIWELQKVGWYWRDEIIWRKPNALPESVRDRCTKSHEYIFMLSKSSKYYYNADAIREPNSDLDRKNYRSGEIRFDMNIARNGKGKVNTIKERSKKFKGNGRNKRSVWDIATDPFKEAHFATFPPSLIEPCILAGSKKGDWILDPFFGSGTTGFVAITKDRRFIGIDLNKSYCEIAKNRIIQYTILGKKIFNDN